MNSAEDYRTEIITRTWFISIILALAGLLCMACSVLFLKEHEYYREIVKELGVVLFAVFTVSLVYEQLLAEKHLKGFISILGSQIERAEVNAAACNELGIIRIFPSRTLLAEQFPLSTLICGSGTATHSRFVALSLFHVMNNSDYLKQSILQGGSIDLCLLSPKLSADSMKKLPDLVSGDVGSAVTVFERHLAVWVEQEKPPGRLELRYHDTPIPESFAYFTSATQSLGVWDLSFGRDLKDKREFVVDLGKRLGQDLKGRFDFIYDSGAAVFVYENRTVKVNNLEKGNSQAATVGGEK